MYHNHTGEMGAYNILKGHCSHENIRLKIRFNDTFLESAKISFKNLLVHIAIIN